MIRKRKILTLIVPLLLMLAICGYLNEMYGIFSFGRFHVSGLRSQENAERDLRVMTWNIHCSEGADEERQKAIAELILNEDADFVQLNEYNQDSCKIIDSLLKIRYHYTEEYQSHHKCGDIFYSKRRMSDSGHVWIPIIGKMIYTIKASIAIQGDSVQLFGCHMASNNLEIKDDSLKFKGLNAYERYKEKQKNRCFQAHWTKENILQSKHPVIVMGDMNDFSFSAPLDTFRHAGLKNAWNEGGLGYGCTFHSGWLRLRIDHILYSKGLNLTNVRIVGTDLSDHNPVMAEFSLAK